MKSMICPLQLRAPLMDWKCLILACVLEFQFCGESMGQGNLTVLRTENQQQLITTTQLLEIPSGTQDPRLRFNFGFSTDEVISNLFADGLTLTLQTTESPTNTAIFLTVDAGGVNWAPVSPGALVISPSSIDREAAPFPNLNPSMAYQSAFAVTASVPIEMTGRPLIFYFDLFNNLNGVDSVAFVSEVTVVPEPAVWTLTLLTIPICFRLQKRLP